MKGGNGRDRAGTGGRETRLVPSACYRLLPLVTALFGFADESINIRKRSGPPGDRGLQDRG